MKNKKIMGMAFTVLLASILMIGVSEGSGTQIVQGKITSSGLLFIILEKQPLTSSYGLIQGIAHDPNFEIYLYNPNAQTNVQLTIMTWSKWINGTPENPTFQNQSISAGQKTMTQVDFSVQLTSQTENMSMTIQGTGYQFQEKIKNPSIFPFYQAGELPFFGWVAVSVSMTIFASFGSALLILRRAKYFPPVQGLKLLFISLAVIGTLASQVITNYYTFISLQWWQWLTPIYLVSLIIFLSYIPPYIKRGILLKFLADHSKGEAYTEIMTILTTESELTDHPEGHRNSGMEHLDRKSYLDFLKRMIGIRKPIVFLDGKLPDQIQHPTRTEPKRLDTMNILKKLRNKKRLPTDYDFGYLLTHEGEVRIEKLPRNDDPEKKREYLIIPLSGHHSSYIEDFLAGIQNSTLKGERLAEYKSKNAELKAEILSGTFLNDLSIVDEIGRVVNLQEELKPTKEPEKAANEATKKLEEKNDGQN